MPAREPTRVALLTPVGRGAVASIAVAGPGAVDCAERCVWMPAGKRFASLTIGHIAWGRWASRKGEDIVLCRITADRVELHCHGGLAAPQTILSRLVAEGCTPCTWQQLAAADEPDPLRRAALEALAQARTERTANILLEQYHGALSRAWATTTAAISAGHLTVARRLLDELLARATWGVRLTRPWRVALAGLPNSGKSSLVNALAGYERSIVDPTPGTTRDLITVATAVDGWPVELIDTAGLRTSGDAIEAEGVARAQSVLAQADLVLLVCDSTGPWMKPFEPHVGGAAATLIVHSKCDLAAHAGPRPAGLRTSAATGEGLAALQAAIARCLVPEVPAGELAVPFLPAIHASLAAARGALLRGDLAAAQAALQPWLPKT